MRAYRGYGPIAYLAMIAFIAYLLGSGFKQIMIIVSVLGWMTVVALAIYMVLFRGMRFSIFKDPEPAPIDAFEEVPAGAVVLDPERTDLVPVDADVVVVPK